MKCYLKYWRDLSKQEKQALKTKHNIKVVSFEFIEIIYNEYKLNK
jgi:lysine/ornithine N-monooxygenase